MTTFRNVMSLQEVADALVIFVSSAKPNRTIRTLLLRTINEFERLVWIPKALDDAYQAHAQMLSFGDDLSVSYEGEIDEALLGMDAMLRKYARMIHDETSKTAKSVKEYTAAEAAAKLGISDEMFKTYASRKKLVTGRKVGRSILYSEAEIERLDEMRNRVGRPKNTVTSEE